MSVQMINLFSPSSRVCNSSKTPSNTTYLPGVLIVKLKGALSFYLYKKCQGVPSGFGLYQCSLFFVQKTKTIYFKK